VATAINATTEATGKLINPSNDKATTPNTAPIIETAGETNHKDAIDINNKALHITPLAPMLDTISLIF